jgi:transposase
MDGAMTKAPLGGEQTGKNPTDRGKIGTKRSLLTDGQGVPLGLAVSGANVHDKRLVRETIASIAIARPIPTAQARQNMCQDKGYDYPDVRQLVAEYGYTAHIPVRGSDPSKQKPMPGYRARRWVVERTHSWFNRFRRLLIRWEKKVANYKAFLHFACAWVTCRAAGVLG